MVRLGSIALAGLVLVPVSLLTGFGHAQQLQSQQDLFERPNDMESLVEEVRDATYEIFCGDGGGSGWGLKTQYGDTEVVYLVTNRHVIEDCIDKGGVTVEDRYGKDFEANIITHWGRDSDWDNYVTEIDFALLEIEGGELNTLSKLAWELPIGSWVMTSSYPGTDQDAGAYTITTGVITSELYVSGFTTDAGVNAGSSGGVVVNSKGEVLGTIFARSDPTEYADVSLFLDNHTLFEVLAKAQREKSN